MYLELHRVNRAWYIPLCLFVAIYCVLGFLCSGPHQVIFQRHKKNEVERSKERGGQDYQDPRPVYFRESHVQLWTMLLIPRSEAAASPLSVVVVALLCFGGCSSPSFPVHFVRIPFGAIGETGHATAVNGGVSFEAAAYCSSRVPIIGCFYHWW